MKCKLNNLQEELTKTVLICGVNNTTIRESEYEECMTIVLNETYTLDSVDSNSEKQIVKKFYITAAEHVSKPLSNLSQYD